MQDALPFAVILGAILIVAVLVIRVMSAPGARRISGPGPGAAGAFHDMLIEDKRKAIELIVEEKTGYVDPESADDLPTTGKGNDVRSRRPSGRRPAG